MRSFNPENLQGVEKVSNLKRGRIRGIGPMNDVSSISVANCRLNALLGCLRIGPHHLLALEMAPSPSSTIRQKVRRHKAGKASKKVSPVDRIKSFCLFLAIEIIFQRDNLRPLASKRLIASR
jgi:hypothetical protein